MIATHPSLAHSRGEANELWPSEGALATPPLPPTYPRRLSIATCRPLCSRYNLLPSHAPLFSFRRICTNCERRGSVFFSFRGCWTGICLSDGEKVVWFCPDMCVCIFWKGVWGKMYILYWVTSNMISSRVWAREEQRVYYMNKGARRARARINILYLLLRLSNLKTIELAHYQRQYLYQTVAY